MTSYRTIQAGGFRTACLECGSVSYGGREDKKFCCTECKNRYNNRRSQTLRNLKLRIRTGIDRNYRILSSLVRLKVKTAELSELSMRGFNSDFVTSHSRSGRKDICACYDIVFTKTPARITSIHRIRLEEI